MSLSKCIAKLNSGKAKPFSAEDIHEINALVLDKRMKGANPEDAERIAVREMLNFALEDLQNISDKIREEGDIPVEAKVDAEHLEPFTHSGYTISPINIRREGKVVQEWSVQTEENKNRAANGERQIGGDAILPTKEAAMSEAERQASRVESNKAYQEKVATEKAEIDKAENDAKAKAGDLSGFDDGLNAMQRGKVIATLSKQTSIGGKVSSLRDAVRQLVADGEKPNTQQENVIKDMTRMQAFRADQRTQDAHDKKQAAAGKKTVYYIGGYDLGKTAHDYAEYLINKNAAPEPVQPATPPLPETSRATTQDISGAAPITAETAGAEDGKVKQIGDKYAKWLDNVAAKLEQEAWGQDVIDTMEANGESPESVAKTFWGKTYKAMPEQGQKLFRRLYKGHTGQSLQDGENPMDMIDLGDKAEYLQGTDRGFVALMREANKQHGVNLIGQGAVVDGKVEPKQLAAESNPPKPAEPANLENPQKVKEAKTEQPKAAPVDAVGGGAEEAAKWMALYSRAQTDTPAFRNWFGDSVVTENGKTGGVPLVVYHGTGESGIEGNIFSRELLGSVTKSRSAKAGFFFVSDRKAAEGYGDLANTKPVADLIAASERAERAKKWDLAHDLIAQAEKLEQESNAKPHVVEAYLSIKNPKVFDADGQRFLDVEDEIHLAIRDAKQNGHDGVILRNLVDNADWGSDREADHYIAFKSEQIKSVSNRGTFDSSNPNILHSRNQPNPSGMTTQQVHDLIDPITSRWTHGNVEVVQSESDVPEFAAAATDGSGAVEGAYLGRGRIILVADSFHDSNRVMSVLAHESVAHMALRELVDSHEYKAAIKNVRMMEKAGNQIVKRLGAEVDDLQPGLDADTRAEEILAKAVESGEYKKWATLKSLVGQIIAKIKKFLRSLGFKTEWLLKMSDVEAFSMLNKGAFKTVRKGEDALFGKGDQKAYGYAEKPAYSGAQEARPFFYSELARQVNKAPERVFNQPGRQVHLWLKSNQAKLGIKSDEIFWSGIGDWLDMKGKEKVSKADVLNFLDQNGVQAQEVMLGERDMGIVEAWWNDEGGANEETPFSELSASEQQSASERYQDEVGDYQEEGAPKFTQYQLPGGTNYKELLLTLPAKTPEFELRSIAQMKEFLAQNKSLSDSLDGLSDVEKLKRVNKSRVKEGATPTFQSSHFEQKNILAHIRMNERTDADGALVLFLEEVQADKGQRWRLLKDKIDSGSASEAERTEFKILDSMPFNETKSWTALALKKAIQYAVENGFSRVAWTTGEQQANRYRLSNTVDAIDVVGRTDAATGEKSRSVQLKMKDGSDVRLGVGVDGVIDNVNGNLPGGKVIGKPLADVIGKDISEKIMSAKTPSKFEGVELDVGGTGMVGYYDAIVPQVANDILKRLGGGKVEDVPLAIHGEQGKWPTTSQPGFTITPSMRQKVVSEGMPLFSKAQGDLLPSDNITPPPTRQSPIDLQGGEPGNNASWDAPESSMFDDLVYKLQNKNVDMKRVIQAITKTGAQIADKWNAYLQEELFHGRSAKRTQDFLNIELKPLMVRIGARGQTIEEVDQYLHARHAQEANALIAERDPNMPDGGSGMTNQEATDYLDGLTPVKRQRLEDTAKEVDAITARTRDLYVSYGLVSRSQMESWANMFEHYVPLMREDKDGAMGIGQGFSIRGKEVKHRTGSTANVSDILANIALQREKVIVRGEKNRVATALAGLAALNPNRDFWTFDKIPTERVLNEATGLVEERANPMFRNQDNVVIAKIKDGKGEVHERAIIFNEKNDRAMRMALAIKNMDMDRLGGILGASARVTRYFASINTQYNPVFGVVNLIRDTQGAALNLASTPLAGHKADVLKNQIAALIGIYKDARSERQGRPATSPMATLWEEMQDEGGMTGYRDLYRNSADRAKALQHELDPHAWVNSKWGQVFTVGGALKVPLITAQKMAEPIFNWLSDYNLAMEGATRLAVYKVAREQGISKQQSASISKNATVNFNRKGQAGQQAGALYAFFNASMQGTARIGEALTTMDGGDPKTIRLSGIGKKVVAGGVLLGVAQAVMLAAAGFDDDEPPEFVRERNLIIPIGGKKYITIPMPLGYHVIPNIGRLAAEYALGGFKDPEKITNLLSITADAFDPLGGSGISMQSIAPTALDPFAALAENKDWTGKPIYREDFSAMHPTPGFNRNKDTATTLSKMVAEAINSLSGGTKYTPGMFSPTADQIDYLAGQVGGGVWREGSKLEQTATSGVTGESLPAYKIPLVGRMYGDASEQAGQSSKFYDNLKRINEAKAEIDGRIKDHLPTSDYRAEHPESRLVHQATFIERRIAKLRKNRSDLLEKNATKEQVRSIEDKITAEMARLNTAISNLRGRATSASTE